MGIFQGACEQLRNSVFYCDVIFIKPVQSSPVEMCLLGSQLVSELFSLVQEWNVSMSRKRKTDGGQAQN